MLFLLPLAVAPIALLGVGIAGYTVYRLTRSDEDAPAQITDNGGGSFDLEKLLAAAPFARTSGFGGVSPATRLQNARIIVREFRAAGVPLGIALAAVVNADHESGLNHTAVGDSGKSVGLFQLHESGGGRGMSTAQRMDPVQNTRRIIQEYQAARANTSGRDLSQGGLTVQMESLDAAYTRGATVPRLAGLFGFHVERPHALTAAVSERAARAQLMFPAIAFVPARALSDGFGILWKIAAGVAVAGAGYYAYRRLRARKSKRNPRRR